MVQMYKDFKDKGLEILAYPCNQFGAQEPGDALEITEFVKKYDVEFPMMEKIEVNGDKADPLYQWLKKEADVEIGWNFEKFIVDGNGKFVAHQPTTTDINGCKSEIEKLLA